MEIKFADSFFKSLNKMISHNRWYWKVWDFIRYDIPEGISNLIYFFPIIWNFRKWDYNFQLSVFKHSLIPLRDELIDGNLDLMSSNDGNDKSSIIGMLILFHRHHIG